MDKTNAQSGILDRSGVQEGSHLRESLSWAVSAHILDLSQPLVTASSLDILPSAGGDGQTFCSICRTTCFSNVSSL